MAGRFLRMHGTGQPLDAGVEAIAPGESRFQSTEALVSNAGRPAGREEASRKGSLSGTAESVQPADLAFYDITSTYFEGAGPAELGRFGYSRDGRPRNRQIIIGVVMMEGWPIAHHVFAGNRLDQTTVLEVVKDLNTRFDLNRVVFVGDRGMMTIGNVEKFRNLQQGYLVGLQRRNRKDTFAYIQQAAVRKDWQECPAGIAAEEKKVVPKTRVVEVPGKKRACACSWFTATSGNCTSVACGSYRWSGPAKNCNPCRPRWRKAR